GADLERVAAGGATRAEQEGWPGRATDEQPTRRTQPPADAADQATRRTAKVDPPVPPPVPAPSKARRTPRRALLLRVALVLALAIVVHDMWVASAARRVARLVSTQELDQLDDMWS